MIAPTDSFLRDESGFIHPVVRHEGRFHCLHTCHDRHGPADFLRAIGLNERAVKRAWNGESTALFWGTKGRRYRTNSVGSVYVRYPQKGETPPDIHKICSGLQVVGTMCNERGENQRVRVRVIDSWGRPHEVDIPRGDLMVRDARTAVAALYDSGLQAAKDTADEIVDYLAAFPVDMLPEITGVDSLGWYHGQNGEDVFILPDGTLYPNENRSSVIVYSGDAGKAANLSSRGSLREWCQARDKSAPVTRVKSAPLIS